MVLSSPPRRPQGAQPIEVLIPEARAHRRRRRLGRTARVVAVVLTAAALVALAMLLVTSPRSGGAVGTAPLAAVGAPALATGVPSPGALPPGIQKFTGFACATPRACVALGIGGVGEADQPVALYTKNGGDTWVRASMPRVHTESTGSVACSGTTCLAAVGYQPHLRHPLLAASSNDGATWTLRALTAATSGVTSLACGSAAVCVVSTSDGTYRTTDGGTRWQGVVVPGVRELWSLSCPTSSYCLGTGPPPLRSATTALAVVSSDGARTWHTVLRLPTDVQTIGAQCLSRTQCAVGADWPQRGGLWETTTGGRSWSAHALPRDIPAIDGFACRSLADCTVWSGRFGGATRAPFGVNVNGLLSSTTDGGTSWSAPVAAPGDAQVQSLTCASRTSCELAGSDLNGVILLGSTTLRGGWRPQPIPVGVVRLEGTACTTMASCALVVTASRGGAVFHTSDRGAAWSVAAVPSATREVLSVTCLTATFCAAAANGLLTSDDGGTSWHLYPLSLGPQALEGVSCASPTDCVLVGGRHAGTILPIDDHRGDAVAWLWRNGHLRRVRVPRASGPLQSVACAGRTCVAVGGGPLGFLAGTPVVVVVSHDAGATWSPARVPSVLDWLQDVTCATPRLCVAVGQLLEAPPGTEPAVIETSDGGGTWHLVPTLHRLGQFNSVACTRAGVCIATGPVTRAQRDVTLTVAIGATRDGWSALRVLALGTPAALGDLRHEALFELRAAPGDPTPRIVRIR